MTSRTMILETTADVLLDQLRDLYSAETQIEAALPAIIEEIRNPAFRVALEDQFQETEHQILRLQEVFGGLSVSARGPRCLGMAGLLQECEDMLRQASRGPILDTVVLACFRRIKHYEIASYSAVCGYAEQLEHRDIESLLSVSLEEELAADAVLHELAGALAPETLPAGA